MEDQADNERNAADIEPEGIDVSKWNKRNGLYVIVDEHTLEMLPRHNDSQVAGHRG